MLLFIKIILTGLFTVLFFAQCHCQTNSICIQLPEPGEAIVSEFYGNLLKNPKTVSEKNPCFEIDKQYIGFIRIEFKKKYADLIIEDSISKISLTFTNDSILIAQTDSELNLIYDHLKKSYLEFSKQIKQLNDKTQQELIIQKRKQYVDSVLNLFPTSFFSRSTLLALTEIRKLTPDEIINIIPFESSDFLHCSVIPNLILKSFGTLNGPDTIQLKKLISHIYSRQMDSEIKTMVTEFMIEFFTSTHEDHILHYILKISNHSYCETDISESAEKKIKQLQLYTVGNYLPDFKINSKSMLKYLKKYKYKNIIVIIWSEDCPHCKPLLQDLNSLKNSEYTFIGIEISGKEKTTDFPFLDLDLRDKEGNKGDIYQKWMIDKTPVVFNIDAKLKIIQILENPYLFFKL